MFFASIFSFVSCLLILFNNSTSDNPELNKLFLHFSKFNCAIIIGLIEIIIVCIYIPELIKTPSNLYIYYNNKKLYIIINNSKKIIYFIVTYILDFIIINIFSLEHVSWTTKQLNVPQN